MDNNLNIKTIHVCRTCMEEIINTSFFHLDFTQVDSEPTIRQKLSNCIPELDLSVVPNTVICGKCADTINSLYIFKEECLRLEMKIHEYIQQVQHTDNAVDLVAVMQFHEHSKNLTAELKTEAFEKIENYKNEEYTTSHCENYAFNETEGYTEIENKEYLTSLAKVDRDDCVLFNTIDNFIDSVKSEAEENSDLHGDSNIVQDCLLQAVENPDSCIQKLNKTDIYYQCFTCGHKAESKLKLIRHLKNHADNKSYQNKMPSKSHKSLRCWYRCDLCNYLTKHKCLFSFHNRTHLTKKHYRRILKSIPMLVKPSTNTITNDKKNNKDGKIKSGSCSSNKHDFKYWCKSFSTKCSESMQHFNKYNVSKLTIDTNIIVNNMVTHTGKKTFKCSACEYSCNQKHHLKSHMLTHTAEKLSEKSFRCSVCEYSCNYRQSLKRHMLTHTGEKPFKCSVCGYSCNQKQDLKHHILTRTSEKQFKCSVCEYSCKNKQYLKSHMLTHICEKPFKCLVCEYSCNHRQNLKRHMLTHTGEKPFKCSVCEYSCNHRQSLNRHMLTHAGEKPFKCLICQYSCNQKQELKRHILTHTSEKQFKCSVCKYSCNRKDNLNSHMLTHTSEKAFKCSVCEHSFNHKSNLKMHLLTHTGEKPFKCSVCGYRCNQKNSLRKHMLTHTGEKPFRCSVCEYSCNHSQSLKSHMLTHTGEKPFKCSVCEHSCKSKCKLKSHMLTHTGEK